MTLGVRGKLFVVSLLLILAVGVVSGSFVERSLRPWLEHRDQTELLHDARAARDLIEALPSITLATLRPAVQRLSTSVGARISVIQRNGALLADTALGPDASAHTTGLGDRPEVRQALETGEALSQHSSILFGTAMLYAAVAYQRPEGRGVVRAAVPMAQLDATMARVHWVLLAAAIIGLLAAVFMSGLASFLLTRTIASLVDKSRALVVGGRERISVESADEVGRIAGSFNQLADELDRSVASLSRERDWLQTILDSMSDAVLALDVEQHVTLINAAAMRLLSLREDPVGRALVEVLRLPALVDLVTRKPGPRDVRTPQAGPEAMRELDLPGPLPRRILARATALHHSGGQVVVLHDITEMRRLERIRRDFVANVSHELRTPVSVIRANAETLLAGAKDDPARAESFLAAIERNAERLSQLIADLLDLSRIEAGRYPLDHRPVDLEAAAHRAIEAVDRLAKDRGTAVAMHVPAGLRAVGDSRAVDQILLNLLDNAVKYTPPGGHVSVRAEPAGAFVRLSVSDDGPGLAAEHRDRVFERFYRVDTGRSREMGGTGLGLSIVKHLAESMGGQAGVQAAQPQGAVFWITLPAER